jgi:acetyl-CoA acetyltransferase
VLLRSGSLTVATVALKVRSGQGPLMIAVALEGETRKPHLQPASATT